MKKSALERARVQCTEAENGPSRTPAAGDVSTTSSAQLDEYARHSLLAVPSLPSLTRASNPSRDQVHRAALLASMSGQPFEYVKFFVYSRRRASDGIVDTPLPVFANSALVYKMASHFEYLGTQTLTVISRLRHVELTI